MDRRQNSVGNRRGVIPGIVVLLLIFVMLYACQETVPPKQDDINPEEMALEGVVNGIDTLSGMAYDENFELVRAKCISCHSPKLITQNRATREGWKAMLDWMYETQNLQDLGEDEPVILDYLAKHYAPKKEGRRANLEDIEWYVLKSEE